MLLGNRDARNKDVRYPSEFTDDVQLGAKKKKKKTCGSKKKPVAPRKKTLRVSPSEPSWSW
jgi:hypothetical protein